MSQVVVIDCIVVTFYIRTGVTLLAGAYIYSVMYIYGGHVVQISTVLILYLTGSVGITAVILIRITVYYDLRGSRYHRSNGLSLSGRLCVRRCTGHSCGL